MRLTLIFDTEIDTENDSIRQVVDSVLRGHKGSDIVVKTLITSLNLDPDMIDIEILESDSFVLVIEEERERLFTKE